MVAVNEKQKGASTADIVWRTADDYLRDVVEEEDYGDYILPFTVLRRLECILEGSKKEVAEYVASLGELPPHLIDIAVKDKFGLSFYNVSPLNMATIASVDDNVDKSLMKYIHGFSGNISDIWEAFDLERRVQVLAKAKRLLSVVKHFSTIDLHPGSVANTVMGDIFEDVMYRAFNKKGKSAGNFYTPRDAIWLMVDILFGPDADSLAGETTLRSIYDPTAGTAGMLLVAQEALRKLNDDVHVTLFGQEMMDSAFALGKADLLIQGGRPDAIKQGNTLLHDQYEGQTFDYVLSNPPFGKPWKEEAEAVKEEAKIAGSRFNHGVPGTSDGQMLFLAHCASKLSPPGKRGHGGRAAVVSNASPLFSSGVGQTSIRQWLLEKDLIDAIVALPTDMFYGTGIATYVWFLDTNKDSDREGKIQLIDGSGQWKSMDKSMGFKRRTMGNDHRNVVTKAYQDFEDADPAISRILAREEFMFQDIPVFKQARYAAVFTEDSLIDLRKLRDFTEEHGEVMRTLAGTVWNELPKTFPAAAKKATLKSPAALIDAVMEAMAVQDDSAPLAVNRKGEQVLVDGWSVTERVPKSADIAEHMEREVLPFAPDAIWNISQAKSGNEIPFIRLFYAPEKPRQLSEIDTDVQQVMSELATMFEEVKE